MASRTCAAETGANVLEMPGAGLRQLTLRRFDPLSRKVRGTAANNIPESRTQGRRYLLAVVDRVHGPHSAPMSPAGTQVASFASVLICAFSSSVTEVMATLVTAPTANQNHDSDRAAAITVSATT